MYIPISQIKKLKRKEFNVFIRSTFIANSKGMIKEKLQQLNTE